MASDLETAKDAFINRNYALANELIAKSLEQMRYPPQYEYYILYAKSLCYSRRLKDALDVYSHVCHATNSALPNDQGKILACTLHDEIVNLSLCRTNNSTSSSSNNSNNNKNNNNCGIEIYDPLLCPICHEIFVQPITILCGHTFCRNCIGTSNQCPECNTPFNDENFEQDILIKKLIEKWFPHEIQASELNEETNEYLDLNSLDDALRCCNESLEKAPNNFTGLLLRSQVLYKLKHYQSSLADADNAMKYRPASYKAHFRRAEALASLGRLEESLIEYCIAMSFENNSSQHARKTTRHSVAKIFQRLLAPNRISSLSKPYKSFIKRRKMSDHHHHSYLHTKSGEMITSDHEDDGASSCGEDEIRPISRRRQLKSYSGCNDETIIPKQNKKLHLLIDRIYVEIEKIRRIEPVQISLHVNPRLIESSDFDCVLCSRTLWKPVVTPCGHTYCWICLDRCMDYSSLCPLCMSPLIEQFQRRPHTRRISSPTLMSLSKRRSTKFIEEAMRRFVPIIYSNRETQELEEEPYVPIFICTTAFPTVPCPLYVFEPRYRLMVRRVIESGERQFGIVLPNSEKCQYHDYGTMLDIRDCLMLGDGCSILSTIGRRRFKIVSRSEKDGYYTAKIDYIHDQPIELDRLAIVQELNRNVLVRAIEWYANLSESIKSEISKSFGQMPELEPDWEQSQDGPSWVWWITAILPLKKSFQTQMLATTSLEKRLKVINKTLINYKAAQQKCDVCEVSCDGLPPCQAIDCCQRGSTSTDLPSSSPSEFLL